jgi:hypothetical protein
VVVVASQAGRPMLWYRNIEADPGVVVQIRGDRQAMRARTANLEERAALWPRLVDLYRDYASYQSWTEREIPVVVLEPIQAPGSACARPGAVTIRQLCAWPLDPKWCRDEVKGGHQTRRP